MAVFATIAFATFFLENDHFVTFNESFKNLAYNFSTLYNGSAYLYSTIGFSEEHTVKFNCVTYFFGITEIMNIQELVSFSFELLSLDFYNCVHC